VPPSRQGDNCLEVLGLKGCSKAYDELTKKKGRGCQNEHLGRGIGKRGLQGATGGIQGAVKKVERFPIKFDPSSVFKTNLQRILPKSRGEGGKRRDKPTPLFSHIHSKGGEGDLQKNWGGKIQPKKGAGNPWIFKGWARVGWALKIRNTESV